MTVTYSYWISGVTASSFGVSVDDKILQCAEPGMINCILHANINLVVVALWAEC